MNGLVRMIAACLSVLMTGAAVAQELVAPRAHRSLFTWTGGKAAESPAPRSVPSLNFMPARPLSVAELGEAKPAGRSAGRPAPISMSAAQVLRPPGPGIIPAAMQADAPLTRAAAMAAAPTLVTATVVPAVVREQRLPGPDSQFVVPAMVTGGRLTAGPGPREANAQAVVSDNAAALPMPALPPETAEPPVAALARSRAAPLLLDAAPPLPKAYIMTIPPPLAGMPSPSERSRHALPASR